MLQRHTREKAQFSMHYEREKYVIKQDTKTGIAEKGYEIQ